MDFLGVQASLPASPFPRTTPSRQGCLRSQEVYATPLVSLFVHSVPH
jgi:hypothetical protein